MISRFFFILISFLFYALENNIAAQVTIDKINSFDVYEVQKALGSNANYFTITGYMDSLIRNGFVLDTAEDDAIARYNKWDWFWNGRNSNANNPSNRGDFSDYLSLMDQYSKSSSSCPVNNTAIQYNWNLKGPIFLSTQNMGRVDVVRTLPGNSLSTKAFAGSGTAGLWRTDDYLDSNPVWKNITDNINLPNIGIRDMVIDPINSDVAYITTGYTGWGNYSMGLFKTINLNDVVPNWTQIFSGPTNQFNFSIGRILLNPSDNNQIFVLRDNEVYISYDAGVTFDPNDVIDVDQLSQPTSDVFRVTDFIIDATDDNIIYLAGIRTGATSIYKLWKFNRTSLILDDITPLLSGVPIGAIKFDNGQMGTYIIYQTFNDPDPNVCVTDQYKIEKTQNSGVSWSVLSQYTGCINSNFPIFEVSDANENFIYLENTGRTVSKSIDGGFNYISQHFYQTSGLTHPDVRGFYMINPSNNGLSDEFFVGNDGGVLYSSSSNGTSTNWENKNGTGLAITQFYGLGQTKKDIDVYAGGTQDNGMIRNSNDLWNVSVLGDGYETYFMEEKPNISFRQDGLGWSGQYRRTTDFLSTTGSSVGLNAGSDLVIANSNCKARYFRQSIIEVNNDLYVSFHNVHKSINDGISFDSISDFANSSFGLPDWFVIEALAISPQNDNIIYAGFGFATWGLNQSIYQSGCFPWQALNGSGNNNLLLKRLYKTTDGGITWLDITDKFNINTNTPATPTTPGATDAVKYQGIVDMVISPSNENKLWIAFDGIGTTSSFECNGVNRVNMTVDGGLTWLDYSKNLPFLPINKIVYYEGTNDGLFAATDIGMYYTDADLYPSEGWIKVSIGLPATMITDIDINYCRGIIRISTFGRGIWEADLQPPSASNDQEITSNTTWNSSRNLTANLVVKSGNTLTINNGAVINIAKDKKIIIEKGAKLIISNATLTNECSQLWNGIEVQGDMNASQLTAGAQGYLEIKNGAIIENARFAVHTSEHDANNNFIWGTFGGIVKVSNSTFRNNRSGIDFGPYQNFVPANPSARLSDLSFIVNTTFTWEDNSNLIELGVQPYSHIGMWATHGIRIVGNDFRNDALYTTYAGMNRGLGLVTFDADYSVISKCNSLSTPCSSYDDNIFVNLTYGIKASASNPFHTLVVKDANFVNCQRGILLKNIDYASLTKNTFDVASPVSPISGNYTYGIYLDNCNGYEVEENFVTTSVATPPNSIPTYGIYAFNSGQVENEIYKNTCENVSIGIQSSYVNGNGDQFSPKGLEFRCNELNNLFAASLSITDILARPYQGICGTSTSPANNSFDYAAGYDIWTNPGLPFIGYTFSADPGNIYGLEPRNPPNTNTNLFKQTCQPFDPNTSCPSRQPLPTTVLLTNYASFKADAAIAGSVIDGGSTANLLLVITNSPDYQIRNELMNASPYLSNKVLLSMLNKTPALPTSIIEQVLAANTSLSDEVFEAMLVRTPTLPDHLIRNIAMESSPLSTKEQLALINNSTLPAWIINQVMIANSPLFDEVLYALMDRFPSIPNWSIRNILMRNTPLSEGVQYALNNHSPSYPNWVKNVINNSPFIAGVALEEPQPSSPLMEVSQEVAEFNRLATLTKNELFRTYLHDTTDTYGIDDVIAFIKSQSVCTTKDHLDLTKAHIRSGQLIEAKTKIDSLIQDTSLAVFCELNSTIIDLKQTSTTLNTNPTAKQSTENIAQLTTATKEKSAAEAMLVFEQFLTYQEVFEPIVPIGNSNRVAPPNTVTLVDKNYTFNLVSVYPNPANSDFTVSYNLNTNKDALFILYEIAGKEVMRKTIINAVGEMKLSTRKLNAGVYFYSVSMDNTIIMQDKLVITKH